MRIAMVVGYALLLSACWMDDEGFCHVQPSTNGEKTFDQTCEGVSKTYTSRGCSNDEDWDAQGECEAACPTKATCRLKGTASVGGTCSATICGH